MTSVRSRRELERPAHSRGVVTQRNVETLLGRLVTNPTVRRRFAADPGKVLREFQGEGFDLTAIELDALAATDVNALGSFAESLDRRIRLVDPGRLRDNRSAIEGDDK
jgi:hypothetical protein